MELPIKAVRRLAFRCLLTTPLELDAFFLPRKTVVAVMMSEMFVRATLPSLDAITGAVFLAFFLAVWHLP
jgi:hypothetical protein